ncbi:MAG: calcium-binding protein [Myxococcales bacterium]|jgi:hypothetical protein
MAGRTTLFLILLAAGACTDASLYSIEGGGANLPDRAGLEGVFCAPSPTGRHFPTRILFLVQGGAGVEPDVRSQVVGAIEAALKRYTNPSIRYGLVAYNAFAFSQIPGGFGEPTKMATALARYTSFSQDGPLSLANALHLAESLTSGAMLGQCPGTRARTRYSVVLLAFEPDPTSSCGALPPDDPCVEAAACAECLAVRQAERIRDLEEKYGAGQITIQPLYVPLGEPDESARRQAAVIAEAGGTRERVADLAGLESALLGLNLAGLDRPVRLRTVVAFNRQARARAGELLPDSDGDGIADGDEPGAGTDPGSSDTDGDGLLDGIELLVGLDPLVPDAIKGCTPGVDEDRDGLTSCEERLLGTEDCMGDTDGDGVPDLVEALSGSNPLQHEQSLDTDRDGFPNLDELRWHTDPLSNDPAFAGSRAYTYQAEELAPPPAGSAEAAADPCPGRPRYRVRFGNIGLVETRETPEREAGANDIYLYAVFAPEGDSGLGALARFRAEPVVFLAPSTRRPPDPTIALFEEDLETRP